MPEEKKKASLYGGEIEIEFNPNNHTYKLAGERSYLISVTSCTGLLDKSRALMPWAVGLAGTFLRRFIEETSGPYSADQLLPAIDEACRQYAQKRDEAASIGDQVHAYAEAFALAAIHGKELPDIPADADERVHAGINGFLKWYTSHEVKFIDAERIIYSRAHGFVGLADAIAEVDGRKVLVDYKTSKGIYTEMRYQVAAYRLAYEEEVGPLDGVILLHFNKETGEFMAHEMPNEDHEKDAQAFLACLALKRREKELDQAKRNGAYERAKNETAQA